MRLSGLFAIQKTLTIRARLNVLAGLMVFCAIVMGVTLYIGDRAVRHAIDHEERYVRLVEITGKIETAALSLAASESDLLLHSDRVHAAAYEKSSLRVLRLLEDIPEDVVDPKITPVVERLRRLAIDQLSDFRTITRFFKQITGDENSGAQGQWRKAAHDAEVRLRHAGLETPLVTLLMMRRHEKDFLLRGRTEYVDAFDRRGDELFRRLGSMDIPEGLRKDITGQIGEYRRNFMDWAEFRSDLQLEIDRQTENSRKLAPAFKEVNSMAAASLMHATAELKGAQSRTNRWMMIVAGGVLGIAALLGFVIGRGISIPLAALTETVSAIAQGNLQQRIPSAETPDEIGDIARALHVFRDNAMARERLEAEQKMERAARRIAERDVQERLEDHAREMANLAEQNSVARALADSANRMKSEFLATMSHELRTPLNAIIGFSEILQQQSFGPLGSDQYCEYADDICDSGKHLLQLINDILDLSKVESGMDTLDETDITLYELVNTIRMMVQQRAIKGGVTLTAEVPEALPFLRADERKIKQILLNLSTNAVKFTEPGGQVIIKSWAEPDGSLVLEVTDSGIGIAPEDISKAMAQFGQVDGAMNRAHEGTGLGLPLCKALVEQHGGTLDLQSSVGVGTTVTVRLPAARVEQREAA